jgi:aminotransferase
MRDFIARRIASVPPSGIRRFFDIAATMDDVISLGIGEPDFVTPDPILKAGIASLESGDTHYTSNSGILALRQALSQHWNHHYGVEYNPESELLITVGVSEALYLALAATLNPGDEVIVPTPCFVSYEPEVVFAGGTPIKLKTRVDDAFQVRAHEIEALITPKTKALLIGYPNNPTGAIMSRERLLEIAQVAEKHDLLVLSDEIYDRLVYDHQHVCFFEGLRHDRLAHRFCCSPRADPWGNEKDPPIHDYVSSDHFTGRGARGAQNRGGTCAADGRGI